MGSAKKMERNDREKFESLKLRQNAELLKILMEESEKDNERDKKLEQTSSVERAKLEKTFLLERAKAQQKITGLIK